MRKRSPSGEIDQLWASAENGSTAYDPSKSTVGVDGVKSGSVVKLKIFTASSVR
jgi:hypothetical protein